eukprot:c50177_g1_i1 orf=331-501(+)
MHLPNATKVKMLHMGGLPSMCHKRLTIDCLFSFCMKNNPPLFPKVDILGCHTFVFR